MNAAPAGGDGRGTGSRWGRFLGAGLLPRALVALIGAPLLVLAGMAGGWIFLGVVGLVILLGLREFNTLAEARGYGSYGWLVLVCGVALAVVVSLRPGWTGAVLTLMVMLVMTSELFRRDGGRALVHTAVTVLGVLWVAWLGSHLVLLRQWAPVDGPESAGLRALGFTVMITWACDTAAYMVGVAIGKHPLLPRVSPKKSVEGAVGGLVGAGLAGWWAASWFAAPVLTPDAGLLLGLVGGVAAQVGDLVQSLLKRDAGLKDTAVLLPGHGGVLDRFDSLLFTAPLVYHVLALGLAGAP